MSWTLSPINSTMPALTPPIIWDLVYGAVKQYAACMMFQPTVIIVLETLLSVMPGSKRELKYRYVFQVDMPSYGREFWLASVSLDEPANGKIDQTCLFDMVELYVRRDTGWQKVLDFEHPYFRQGAYYFYRSYDEGSDFPDVDQFKNRSR